MDTNLYVRHYVNYNYRNKGVDNEIVNRIEKLYLNEIDHLKHLKKNKGVIDKMETKGFFKIRKQEMKNIVENLKDDKEIAQTAIDIVNQTFNDFLKTH